MPVSDPASRRIAHPVRRLLGLLVIGAVLLLYRPGADPTLFNDLVLPLLAAAAVAVLTGSALAVLLGVFLLALAHSAPGAEAVLAGLVYPAIALASGVLLAGLLLLRFRSAMASRRARKARQEQEQEK